MGRKKMKKIRMILAGTILALSFSTVANAATINFESVTDGFDAVIPYVYEGFNWNDQILAWKNTSYSSLIPNSSVATVSGNYFAFNNWPSQPIAISSTNAFNFDSVWLTSLTFDTDIVKIIAYNSLGGTIEDTLTIYGNAPTLYTNAAFQNINKIEFGYSNINYASPNYLGMDDFSYSAYTPPIEPPISTPAPEPSSMILGLMGLSSMLGLKKRK
jgi:hypothetical protein